MTEGLAAFIVRENPSMASPIVIKDPADRFDLSYVFANNYAALGKEKDALREMAQVAREIAPGVSCRTALVHAGEIVELVELLKGSTVRSEIVIDFPDGAGGAVTKAAQAHAAAEAGAIGGDLVINLHAVEARDKKRVLEELRAVSQELKEVKVIAQIPYLWQYDKESIPWLLDILPEGGIYCIKDWTTRVDNFLLPDGDELDYQQQTRLTYIEFMAKYIADHSLPLTLKIAGRVTPENVRSFVDAGAVLIGTSYRKAPSLRQALLG